MKMGGQPVAVASYFRASLVVAEDPEVQAAPAMGCRAVRK